MFTADLDPRILIIGGTAIFSVLVFFIVLFIIRYQKRHHSYIREKQELENNFHRELLKTQLETQDYTLNKIGEELHDNIGQLLSTTRMLLGITERSLAHIPDTLNTASQTLVKAIQELRMLSKSLNNEWLSQFNLIHNLRTEVERINSARTVFIQLEAPQQILPLEPASQVMLFRVIQEALQNSIKHANADKISISFELTNNVCILLQDNGKGFNIHSGSGAGLGIINMKKRIHLLGGRIHWKSDNTHGTEVSIQLPFQPEIHESQNWNR